MFGCVGDEQPSTKQEKEREVGREVERERERGREVCAVCAVFPPTVQMRSDLREE